MTETKKYEIRQLQGDDIFVLLPLIAKLGIKDDLVKIFSDNVDAEANAPKVVPMDKQGKQPTKKELEVIVEARRKAETEATKRGIEAGAVLIEKLMLNIGKVKNDINLLIVSLTGLTKSEVEALPLAEYIGLIKEIVTGPGMADFLTQARSFLK